jgi:hypothetical protein
MKMNRNTSIFESNPVNLDIQRSTFNRDSSLLTTFNTGEVVPFYLDEVLPGDTFSVKTNKVVRLQTPLTPFMDTLFLDTYYFFVPCRLVWEHWKQFNGENTESPWIPEIEYEVPQITAPEAVPPSEGDPGEAAGWRTGTIADYFGIPVDVGGLSVNAMPFRAYALIINEWFRDQNLQQPLNIPTGDSTVTGTNGNDYVTDIVKGGRPFIASKYRDYFTTCLPAPQKGPDVGIGLTGEIDVFGNGKSMTLYGHHAGNDVVSAPTAISSNLRAVTDNYNRDLTSASGGTTVANAVFYGIPTKESGFESNIYADLSSASSISINALRTAFAIQRLYEKDARGGTRYIEIIKAHFGVTSPDSRMQRPEYLGGNRIPLQVNQVVQQSETGSTPMGDTAGVSLTYDSNSDFTKSFTEHGYIIGVMVARYNHTYQQGLDRLWSRKDRFDFYWPVFANLGEQAVKNKEIFAQGLPVDDEVFGYNEAWADYRFKLNKTTGEMRSQAPLSLDSWHFADDYNALPSLSDEWIREDKSNVDRVLAVSSSVSNQIFADIYIANRTTRPMPLHSIPGLIDHH